MTDLKHKILWVDGCGGVAAGLLTVLIGKWLSGFYGFTYPFMLMIGIANLSYGCFSLTLARLQSRPPILLHVLIVANVIWGLLCLRWIMVLHDSASLFGIAHLAIEGAYVASLGCLEWRWRHTLYSQ